MTKGESNFFLLARSLPLSLGVALSPGQIIFRAFEIVGARAPPLASASWAQRRETPSRGGGGGGGAGRRPPRFTGAGAGVAAAGQPRPLGEQHGDVFLGLELWSGSLFPTGAPRGGGRSSVTRAAPARAPPAGGSPRGRLPTRCRRRPRPRSAPRGPSCPLSPAQPRDPAGTELPPARLPGPRSYFLFRSVSGRAPSSARPARRRPGPRRRPGAPAARPATRRRASGPPARPLLSDRGRHRLRGPRARDRGPGRGQVGAAAPRPCERGSRSPAEARLQRSGECRAERSRRRPFWSPAPPRASRPPTAGAPGPLPSGSLPDQQAVQPAPLPPDPARPSLTAPGLSP